MARCGASTIGACCAGAAEGEAPSANALARTPPMAAKARLNGKNSLVPKWRDSPRPRPASAARSTVIAKIAAKIGIGAQARNGGAPGYLHALAHVAAMGQDSVGFCTRFRNVEAVMAGAADSKLKELGIVLKN